MLAVRYDRRSVDLIWTIVRAMSDEDEEGDMNVDDRLSTITGTSDR